MAEYTSVSSGTDSGINLTTFQTVANYVHSGTNYDEYRIIVVLSSLNTGAENAITFRLEDAAGGLMIGEDTVTVPTADSTITWYSQPVILNADAEYYVKAKSGNSNDTSIGTAFVILEPTLDGKIDTIDSNVDAILVDTGSTLDGKINTIDTLIDGIIAGTSKVTPVDVDGLTHDSMMTAMMAVMFGVTNVSGSTVTYKECDGTTTKVTITYGSTDGERTGSTVA